MEIWDFLQEGQNDGEKKKEEKNPQPTTQNEKHLSMGLLTFPSRNKESSRSTLLKYYNISGDTKQIFVFPKQKFCDMYVSFQ